MATMTGIDFDDFRIDARPAEGVTLTQPVLRTDVAGMPLEWIDYREAARLYHQQQVAYTCGTPIFRLFGGTNALTGRRTILEVNSIVATVGQSGNPGYLRDDYLPMYTFRRSVARFDGDRSVRIRARLAREKKHKAGTTSIWRFYERHAITFKKNAFTLPSRIGLTLPRHALN
jgi:hypothetical protein